ncbi:MAG: ribonuclease P protein component [Candidatus Peribacteria bacterium]|nr:MAG: ribonuclease P protein component [Candidatus Peribacteria bacterium]
MFSKKQRLQRRDVQYLLRRGNKCYGKTLIFTMVPQRGRSRSQRSIQIPVKVDKRATMRNMLKRSFLVYIKSQEYQFQQVAVQRVKVFVMINKQAIPDLTKLIA